MIFKIQDNEKIPIHLTDEVWKEKILHPDFGHPEVKPYLDQIKTVVKNPEYVFQSIRDKRSKLYVNKITKGKFSGYYLLVVIKYVKEKGKHVGYVSTAFITCELPKKSKQLK